MSRFTARGRQLVAVGVPALLMVALVGCGRQEAVQAERAAADAAERERQRADEAREVAEKVKKDAEKSDPKVGDAKDSPGQNAQGEPGGTAPADPGAQPNKLQLIPSPVVPGLASAPPPAGTPAGPIANYSKMPSPSGTPGRPAQDSVLMGGSGAGKPNPAGGEAKPEPKPQTGYNALNAEQYGTYVENEFRSPLVAPLSTFSADVNTASYANVRRFLTEGKLPPAGAVFLAEFVNYFPYSYAQPKGDDPVAFHVEMGPCPWNRKHHLVRVGMQAYQIPAEKMPPRNLVFLIDTSGSMQQENRLPLVQKSLALLVDKLTEKDRVSVVTYAGYSTVVLGPTKGSEKKAITDAINGLSAGGGTNGEGGIKKAYELARETFMQEGVNRVVLCTDGDFNVGVTDDGSLVKMIEEQRKSKVFLTILGYGMGNYKDERLKELANHGNGHHAYIDTIDEAKKVFVEQGGALVCVAKDVKFQVDFNPARVNAYRLVGYENRLLKDEDFKNDAKDAGDLGSGHQVTVLYEVVPKGVEVELPKVDPSKYQKKEVPDTVSDEWLTVKMRYKHPEAETSKELARPLKGEVAKDLSDDFRFAAAAASFGMILRDSKFRGAMTYAGVLEEAQGCLGADPGGHRKQFCDLVQIARMLAAGGNEANGALAAVQIDEETVRKLALAWSADLPQKEPKKWEEVIATIPPKYHAAVKEYFEKLRKAKGEKK